MNHHDGKIAGSLLLIGGIQCVLGIILAEALYPGYNTSIQTISSLGVGPSAIIFNSSVFLIGVLGLAGIYFVHRALNFNLFTLLLGITFIGAIGMGLFTEAPSTVTLYSIFSVITYVFGGLSAILSYKLQKQPLSIFSDFRWIFTLGNESSCVRNISRFGFRGNRTDGSIPSSTLDSWFWKPVNNSKWKLAIDLAI